ncbi:MAG: hypothetical protein AAB250_12070, partial [Bdellovibrionota bacterium]
KRIEKILIGDLTKPFTIERKDTICSAAYSHKLKLHFDAKAIPAARWTDRLFVDSLACIASFDTEVWYRAHSAFLQAPAEKDLWYTLGRFLGSAEIPEALATQVSMAATGDGSKGFTKTQIYLACNYSNRFKRALPKLDSAQLANADYVQTMGCISDGGTNIAEFLSLANSADKKVSAAGKSALRMISGSPKLRTAPVDVLRTLAKLSIGTVDAEIAHSAASIVAASKTKDPEIIETFLGGVERAFEVGQPNQLHNRTSIAVALKAEHIGPELICARGRETTERFLNSGNRHAAVNWASFISEIAEKNCPQMDKATIGNVLHAYALELANTPERKPGDKSPQKYYNTYSLMKAVRDLRPPTNDFRDIAVNLTYGGWIEDPKTIFSLMNETELKKQTANAILTGSSGEGKLALVILTRFDIQDARVDSALEAKVRPPSNAIDERRYLEALSFQDQSRVFDVVKAWVEVIATAEQAEKVSTIVYYVSDGASLLPFLKASLDRKIKDDVKSQIVYMMTSLNMDWAKLKPEMQNLLKKNYSKAVKDSIRDAIESMDESDEENDER